MSKDAQLLTPRQVADQLTEAGIPISDEAVRAWARTGRVPSTLLPSGRRLIHPDTVQAIIRGEIPGAAA